MNKLKIITSTTRPGRKGIEVAAWINEIASNHAGFDVELLDLAEINLPLFDEPEHPRLKKYTHDHTKKWSAKIDDGDAFIITLAEYNNGVPAPIKNAIDFLYHEWRYKPVGFVSYGGVSAGIRSLQMIKQVVTALSMMPVASVVNIPFFSKYLTEQGRFEPEEIAKKSASAMLDELTRWADAMKPLRKRD
jgi:NAD(P)H-dependent FMN reductase